MWLRLGLALFTGRSPELALSHSLFLRKLPQCGSTRGCLKVINILSRVWHEVTGPVSHGPRPTSLVTLRQTAPQSVNHFHAPPEHIIKDKQIHPTCYPSNRAKVPADYVIASNSKIFAVRLLRARQLNVRFSSMSDFINLVILNTIC